MPAITGISSNALGVFRRLRGSMDDAIKSFQRRWRRPPDDGVGYSIWDARWRMRYGRNRSNKCSSCAKWVADDATHGPRCREYKRYLEIGGRTRRTTKRVALQLGFQLELPIKKARWRECIGAYVD